MGRWGLRLFEGDHDMDLASDLDSAFDGDPNLLRISELVNGCWDTMEEYNASIIAMRKKLDMNGLGERFLQHWRHDKTGLDPEYRFIVAGALMMRAGAKIDQSHIQHMRHLAGQVTCNQKYTLPMFDLGFRAPGRAQFLAALDHYQPGTPRDFGEPSCFQCGKAKEDIGKPPMKCAHCKMVWYCDKDCQKAHWRIHKPECKPMEERFMLNV
ncbi:hypothetical protein F4780DRAFT_789627 [Xylariomycetidae sp. FL0641]|nr:hypothetical protein F4780DRAFT_789627 [Xylariomycetidae sp. FL0641]